MSLIGLLRRGFSRATKIEEKVETLASPVEIPRRCVVVVPDAWFLLQQIEKLKSKNAVLEDKLSRSEAARTRLLANYNRSFFCNDVVALTRESSLQKEFAVVRDKFNNLKVDFDNLKIDFLAFRAATFSRHKINPRDYRRVGKFTNFASRRKFESLFDREWYSATYPDVESAGIDSIVHYFEFGFSEGRFPHPLFDTRWYLKTYDDVLNSGINPFEHFLTTGVKELRQPNAFFDLRWYLERYFDVASGGLNPFEHYLRKGYLEARDPGPLFSAAAYFEKHPELEKGKVDALVHRLHSA